MTNTSRFLVIYNSLKDDGRHKHPKTNDWVTLDLGVETTHRCINLIKHAK